MNYANLSIHEEICCSDGKTTYVEYEVVNDEGVVVCVTYDRDFAEKIIACLRNVK